jgi:hypothetical protein
VSPLGATETRAARLLRVLATLEETIVRLELRDKDGTAGAVRRLQLVRSDVADALRLLH